MTVPDSEAKPVRVLGAVAAGALVISTGLPVLTPAGLDWIGGAVGLVGLVVTAVVTSWTEGRVTPSENVEARRLPSGRVVAGEGSAITTGAPVDVIPNAPANWLP